jgi:hypothetical protein
MESFSEIDDQGTGRGPGGERAGHGADSAFDIELELDLVEAMASS